MLLTQTELKKLEEVMTPEQVMFCHEYIVDFNGTRSARAAGYSPKALRSTASRLLTHSNVRTLVNHLKLQRMKRIEVTADKVVQELARIAFHDTADFMDKTGSSVSIKDFDAMGDQTRVIKTIKTAPGGVMELVLHDKMKALEMLGRHMSLFTDNVNNTNNGGDMPKTQVSIYINHRKPGTSIESAK